MVLRDQARPTQTLGVVSQQTNGSRTTNSKGDVRVRSNVTNDPKAWNLVPGDELKRHGLHYNVAPTSKQHMEMMYYEPCSLCNRKIYEIKEYGCDEAICQQQGILSRAETERKKASKVDHTAVDKA